MADNYSYDRSVRACFDNTDTGLLPQLIDETQAVYYMGAVPNFFHKINWAPSPNHSLRSVEFAPESGSSTCS